MPYEFKVCIEPLKNRAHKPIQSDLRGFGWYIYATRYIVPTTSPLGVKVGYYSSNSNTQMWYNKRAVHRFEYPTRTLPFVAPFTAPKGAVESSVGGVLVAFMSMDSRLLGCPFLRFMTYEKLSKIFGIISFASVFYMYVITEEGTYFLWGVFWVFLALAILFNHMADQDREIERLRNKKDNGN